MNNKGFTLIELIATVLVLCLISLIAVVSINKVVKDSDKNGHKVQAENILTSAITYVSTNNEISLEEMDGYKIYLKELANGGYIEKNIVDPINDKVIDYDKTYILITKENDTSKTVDEDLDYKYSGNYLYVLNIIYK